MQIAMTNETLPALIKDSLSIEKGGIRTPWVDAPLSRLTGDFRGASLDITGLVERSGENPHALPRREG